MADIKLAKLPDRAAIKITIAIRPDLNRSLARYAEFYRAIYEDEESIGDLIPAMVEAFLESDRAFARWCRDANARPE